MKQVKCNKHGKYTECRICGHRQGHDCSAEIPTEEIFVVTGCQSHIVNGELTHEPMYNPCRGRCVELEDVLSK